MTIEKAIRLGYILSHLSELKDINKVYNTVWFRFVTADGLYSVPMDVFTIMVLAIGLVVDAIVLLVALHWIYVRRCKIASLIYAAFVVMFLGMTSEDLMR